MATSLSEALGAEADEPRSAASPALSEDVDAPQAGGLCFYLFISPWIIGFVVFLLGPMIASVYISLTDWDSFTPPNWVGLDNYTRLLTEDPVFWKALWNTFYYARDLRAARAR